MAKSLSPQRLFGLGMILIGIGAIFLTIYRPLAPAPTDPWNGALLSFGEGPIKVTAFISYDCKHCRKYILQTQKDFFEAYVWSGKVRYSERLVSLTPLGQTLSKIGYCIYQKRGAEDYLNYERQVAEVYDRLKHPLKPSEAQLYFDVSPGECEGKEFEKALEADELMAKAVMLAGTPTFFVDRSRHMGEKTLRDWARILKN